MIDALPVLILVLLFQLVLAVYLLFALRRRGDEQPKRKRKNDEIDPVQRATGLKGGYVVSGELKIPFGDERRRVLELFELRREEERMSDAKAIDNYWKSVGGYMRWVMLPSRLTIEAIPEKLVQDERPIPFPTKRMK